MCILEVSHNTWLWQYVVVHLGVYTHTMGESEQDHGGFQSNIILGKNMKILSELETMGPTRAD